jgi:hypothetical protein
MPQVQINCTAKPSCAHQRWQYAALSLLLPDIWVTTIVHVPCPRPQVPMQLGRATCQLLDTTWPTQCFWPSGPGVHYWRQHPQQALCAM